MFPICCATTITAETINHFITVNQDYDDQMECDFALVDNLEKHYEEPSEIGELGPGATTASPFAGKTLEQCQDLLRQMPRAGLESGTSIDCNNFGVLDERSCEDDSITIVQQTDNDGLQSVRVSFELANALLIGYWMYDFDIFEGQRVAQESEGGILRRLAGYVGGH